jgi:mRNA-degrading endonuclease RelE of RelBE toxin-antitoxin system
VLDPDFSKNFMKIRNQELKEKTIKQIAKLKNNPELGKPMMYMRKGTRELYLSPFRLSYIYLRDENKIIILDIYHKDKQ